MPYWRHFYHLIWATQNREPMIDDAVEHIISRSLADSFDKLNVIPHAVGVVADHLHVVVSIPPALSVADTVHQLKGASSRAVNKEITWPLDSRFGWQTEYGSLTIGERSLIAVVEYVQNQKRHHTEGSIKREFERINLTPARSEER